MMLVVFHDLAIAEFDGAARHYESQRPGLGSDFRISVENAVKRAQINPHAGSKYGRTNYRFVLVRRFPYVIYYAEADDAIRVMAVAHGRRRPGYWRKRAF